MANMEQRQPPLLHIKAFISIQMEMDEQRFNELLEEHKYDSKAKEEFCQFCLGVIKNRLIFRGEKANWESLSHSVLVYFLSHIPKSHVVSPWDYLNKSVDNFLSNRKKKRQRIIITDKDFSYKKEAVYEQSFDNLEKIEIYNSLAEELGEVDAFIICMVKIEEIPEREVAKMVGLKYATLRKRVSRITAKLEEKYEKYVTKKN